MRKVLVIILLTGLLLGQWSTTADATSAGSFTMRPVGARSLGMGAAVVAVAEDGSMGYWNPAGLAFINRSEVYSMQGTMLGDVDYLNLGYNRLPDEKTWDFALGFNWINTRVEGIKEATYKNGNARLTGSTFGYEGNAYVISGARILDKRLAVGLNFKYLQETLFDHGASGTGFDLGLLYRVNSRTKLGLVYQNILPPRMVWDTDNDTIEALPFNVIIGVAHKITNKFMLAVDVGSRSDRGLSTKVGGELKINKYFTVRAGFDQDRLFLGTSLYYDQFGVHYAFANVPVGEVVDEKHFLSLSYILEEQEDLIEPLEEEVLEEVPKGVTPGAKIPKGIEEIPLIELHKDVVINKMVVKKLNGTIQTEIVIENIGDVTVNVRSALSIYNDKMYSLQVFPAKRVTLEPNKVQTVIFDWHRKTELPYGEYYFKARIAYNSQEKAVMKKVVRRKY